MRIDLTFLLLLLGHVLGDFYLQSKALAQQKEDSAKALLRHSLLYALTLGAVLFAGLRFTQGSALLAASAGLAHFLIDLLKFGFLKGQKKKARFPRLVRHSFLLDQLLHLASLGALWALFWQEIILRPFVTIEIAHLPALPIELALCFLLVLEPVGLLIAREVLGGSVQLPQAEDVPGAIQNAGKTIGYLERVIVVLLLLYGQYSAIAFVLTAKSVARFKEIEQSRITAEYYLIGTLSSVAAAFGVAFLLGLCG